MHEEYNSVLPTPTESDKPIYRQKTNIGQADIYIYIGLSLPVNTMLATNAQVNTLTFLVQQQQYAVLPKAKNVYSTHSHSEFFFVCLLHTAFRKIVCMCCVKMGTQSSRIDPITKRLLHR